MKTLEEITLESGKHKSPEEGMCLLEATAYIAGEEFGDHPKCVCPVLAAFGRAWNDSLPDNATRDRLLKPFIPRLIGTRSTLAIESRRAWMAKDWLVRVFKSAWLRLAKLTEHADAVSGLAEIKDEKTLLTAKTTIQLSEKVSAAACFLTRDATSAATWDAAYLSARDVANTAAYFAALDAADVALDIINSESWTSVRAAVWHSSRDGLAQTVTELQTSAVDLFNRMIEAR